ncbi:MAG: c-type cytochrome [Comamonadaceae bacterium]
MLIALSFAQSVFAADEAAALDAGRRLFDDGVLPNGAQLIGKRTDGTVVSGATAACATCHRPSGMGSVESDIQVPPITGRFLFPDDGEKPLATMDPRIGKRMNLKRFAHTDASLVLAMREGVGSNGHDLSVLMPRYEISDADMSFLTAYLRQLSVQPSPGVEDRTIRFATVIAPGVDAGRKKIMLDMLRIAVNQKNGSTVVGNASRRHMVTAAELVLGTENKWVLDVWELKGAPQTWGEQLRGYNRLAPPFALLSGLSDSTWAPVEEFCESEHVPCWFPSVAATPQHVVQPKYAFYFSRGLLLEADVLAQHLTTEKVSGRLIQILRGNDAGKDAAEALNRHLSPAIEGNRIKPESIDLNQWSVEEMPAMLEQRLKNLSAKDTVVMWLRPVDLKVLEPVLAQLRTQRFASGTLLSGNPLFMPEGMRKGLNLVYPYELPQVRQANLGYMYVWLKMRRIPLVDEPMQSEVYFAINFLTDTMSELLDNLFRDYLVERAESMIGQRENRKAEAEVRDQMLVRPRVRTIPMDASIPRPTFAPGHAEHTAGLREGTTIYPRLSLGAGQRYASKGAYIVHYAGDASDQIVAQSSWIVP